MCVCLCCTLRSFGVHPRTTQTAYLGDKHYHSPVNDKHAMWDSTEKSERSSTEQWHENAAKGSKRAQSGNVEGWTTLTKFLTRASQLSDKEPNRNCGQLTFFQKERRNQWSYIRDTGTRTNRNFGQQDCSRSKLTFKKELSAFHEHIPRVNHAKSWN